jgi:hypothetical protein
MRIFLSITGLLIMACMACKKNTAKYPPVIVNGRLLLKGSTAYTYGTHKIVVDAYTTYIVESTSLNLNSFTGDSVHVSMQDMGYRVNPGPELYNVTTITPL